MFFFFRQSIVGSSPSFRGTGIASAVLSRAASLSDTFRIESPCAGVYFIRDLKDSCRVGFALFSPFPSVFPRDTDTSTIIACKCFPPTDSIPIPHPVHPVLLGKALEVILFYRTVRGSLESGCWSAWRTFPFKVRWTHRMTELFMTNAGGSSWALKLGVPKKMETKNCRSISSCKINYSKT